MYRPLIIIILGLLMAVPAGIYLAYHEDPHPKTPVAIERTTDRPIPHTTAIQKHMDAMMAGIQKDMGAIMTETQAVMDDTNDPALKARLHKVHDDMHALLTNIQASMDVMGWSMSGGTPIVALAPKTESAPATMSITQGHSPP